MAHSIYAHHSSIPASSGVHYGGPVMQKGQPVHYVSESDQHHLCVITEVVDPDTQEVILQIDDPARPAGRYTTGAFFDASLSVGSWHWVEAS